MGKATKQTILRGCIIVLFAALCMSAAAQSTQNLGFESGTFTGWTGYTWRESLEQTSINTLPVQVSLPTARRHVIIADKTAYDANTGGALKMIPDGYNYSARLGCEIVEGTDSQPRCWEQSLRYTMTVTPDNVFLLMKFACVLEYAVDHSAIQEPRFKLTLYNSAGDTIPDCSNYDVFSSASIEGFQSYTPAGARDPVMWRNWTTVGADLSAYMGQQVTIEFMTADCKGQYHYGYAYFVADAMPLYITVDFCTNDEVAILEGPDGFKSYQWLDTDGLTVIGTTQNLTIDDPVEGAQYTCKMVSETGCQVQLSSVIARYTPKADFSWEMKDCETNQVAFTNQSTTNNGSLNYVWDFGDGNTSTDANPLHQFATSGWHKVNLLVKNPPSGCTDTLTQNVESFSPPLVGFSGDTTFCPGGSTTLTGYGADHYKWSTNSTADAITLSSADTYWMEGYSSAGCSTRKTFTLTEDPAMALTITGNTAFCTGSSVTLTASGAATYLWSTGSTGSSIQVSSGGTYSLTGYSAFGCSEQQSITVTEEANPYLNFTLSAYTVDVRHNSIDCAAEDDQSVSFTWDMGDGYTKIGTSFTHNYNVPNLLTTFTVTVTAENLAGCTTSKSAVIAVTPFVPNVFSPNNDGINDFFMPDFEQEVFDRHGLSIYKGSTGCTGWDGYYKGRPADPDTYFYVLKYTDLENTDHVRRGFITLVKQ